MFKDTGTGQRLLYSMQVTGILRTENNKGCLNKPKAVKWGPVTRIRPITMVSAKISILSKISMESPKKFYNVITFIRNKWKNSTILVGTFQPAVMKNEGLLD